MYPLNYQANHINKSINNKAILSILFRLESYSMRTAMRELF